MSDPSNPWTTLNSRLVYENPWIRVREDQVLQPDGQPGIYGVVEFKNRAVGVLPIDDEGCIWLVGQHRYPLGSYSWEIPEGGSPQSEPPEETARRELKEETGLVGRPLAIVGVYSGPDRDPCAPADICATLFQALGVPPTHEVQTPSGRRMQIFREGRVLEALLA